MGSRRAKVKRGFGESHDFRADGSGLATPVLTVTGTVPRSRSWRGSTPRVGWSSKSG
jgi:hypothetical protein